MKILTLTWEFPPVITGGLGMACYGIVKALLEKGAEVDLVTPSKETIYFPLRNPGDADKLPVAFADPAKYRYMKTPLSTEQQRKLIGTPIGAYCTPGTGVSAKHLFTAVKKS